MTLAGTAVETLFSPSILIATGSVRNSGLLMNS